MAVIEFILFVSVLLFFLYKWSTTHFNTFTERGVAFKKPLPLLGNALPFLQNKMSMHKFMLRLYQENKQHKIFGFYNFRKPLFIIQDPDLVRLMGIKDFDYFTNHQQVFNFEKDPLFGGMLTVMKDQRWKDMRNTVTPVFTGAKMRAMFTLMNECFAESMKYLHDQSINGQSFDIELKECFCRLSNDLIATTAFGLKINSYKDKNNEFFSIGTAFTKTRGQQAFKFMFAMMLPKLFDLLGMKIFDPVQVDYFVRLVVDAMKYRTEHNIIRPDMIQLLMEAKKESTQQWSDNDIVAQCFIFFFAAFENNANLLCTTCNELMENPDVQEKLYEEICEMKAELNGKTLDYDALKKMKYLDMVVSESLRKWSLAAIIDRECSKDYTVKDEDGNVLAELKKGDNVWFQVIGFHWDEQYFEHPEVFDPERFSDENKHNIKPNTYLPFGVGPRICIGNRYALMQAKAMLYYFLQDFKLARSPKTFDNLLDDIRGFQMAPKSGFWLTLQPRKMTTQL